MGCVIYSRQIDEKPIIAQKASDWILAAGAQQTASSPDFFEDTVVATELERQLEIYPRQVVDDLVIFKCLVDQWRIERGSTSSTTEMVLCPAYQSIIGMGPRAIRFILAELVSEGDDPDHWFWALQALTGANPVFDADEGNLRRMTKAWLEWAATEGYAW